MLVNIDDMKRHYQPLASKADELIKKLEALEAAKVETLCAVRGGSQNHGDEKTVEAMTKEEKKRYHAMIDPVCEEVKTKLDECIDSAFMVEPFILTEWAPILGNVDLSDDDLRAIARKYRNYSMYRAVISNGKRSNSDFAKKLENELSEYREGMKKNAEKLIKQARRAVKNDNFFGSYDKSWKEGVSDSIFDDMQALNSSFDAFLDDIHDVDYGDSLLNMIDSKANE